MEEASVLVSVAPLAAILTHDTEYFSSMSPYVRIELGGQVQETGVHRGGGKRPHWTDRLAYRFPSMPGEIHVMVMDKRDIKGDDVIGEAYIPVSSGQAWHGLTYNGKRAGDIEILIQSDAGMGRPIPMHAVSIVDDLSPRVQMVDLPPGFQEADVKEGGIQFADGRTPLFLGTPTRDYFPEMIAKSAVLQGTSTAQEEMQGGIPTQPDQLPLPEGFLNPANSIYRGAGR